MHNSGQTACNKRIYELRGCPPSRQEIITNTKKKNEYVYTKTFESNDVIHNGVEITSYI